MPFGCRLPSLVSFGVLGRERSLIFAGPNKGRRIATSDTVCRVSDRLRYPIVVKCQDLAEWVLGRTAKFPRMHRASLSTRVEDVALDLLCCVTRAAGNPGHRHEWLVAASDELNALRILVRACALAARVR